MQISRTSIGMCWGQESIAFVEVVNELKLSATGIGPSQRSVEGKLDLLASDQILTLIFHHVSCSGASRLERTP